MADETPIVVTLDEKPGLTKDKVVEAIALTLVTAATTFLANVAIGRIAQKVEARRATKPTEDPS
jgi:hypothetical protein